MAIFINSQRLIQLCDYEQGKILEKVKLAKKKKKIFKQKFHVSQKH